MKRIFLIALALVSGICSAQTFKVQNLDVLGTSTLTGLASFTVRPQFNGNTPWDSGNFNPSSYAMLASPAFTGIPTAPTAATGTNSTQLATTAFIAQHDPCPSILDHGGNNGGVVDNSAAFSATVAASPSGQACVYFPPGTYAFSSQLVYSLPSSTASISIQGAGADVSTLAWAAGGGMQLNVTGIFNTIDIRDLSIVTGTTATGIGIEINNNLTALSPQPISHISNVAVHGADGYGNTDYWATGILVNNVNNVNIINPSVWGGSHGIGMEFTSGSQIAVQYDLFGADIQSVDTGIEYTGYSQGLNITGSNIVGCTNGILIPASQHATNLTVNNSQISCTFAGIQDLTGILFIQVSNSLFIIPPDALTNAAGIFLSRSCGFSITGNIFFNPSATVTTFGFLNQTQACGGVAGMIAGNSFQGLHFAVYLDTGSGNVNVQSNAYGGNTTNTTNLGTGNTIGGGSP